MSEATQTAAAPAAATAARRLIMVNQKDLSVPSGETTHIVELARALAEEGEQVTVVSPALGRYGGEVPFTVRYLPVPRRPRALMLLCLELVLAAWLLTRREVWGRRAVIYVRKGVFMLTPLLVARLFRLPSLLEVNGAETEMAQQHGLARPVVWALLVLSRAAYRLAGHIITVTPGLASYLEHTGRVPPHRISVFANGANTRLFRPQPRAECCLKLGLDPARRYICFTGHMAFWHRLDLLVEAFALLAPSHPDTCLLLVGKGEAAAGLKHRLAELGLAERALFPGPVPFAAVPDYVGAATVCVALATIDRLSPIKLFEYLACGRPVVVSDTVGLAEPVRESGGGIICKPEARSLAAALQLVLAAEESVLFAMGERGRAAAVEKYSWQAVAQRTLALIDALAQGGNRLACHGRETEGR